MQNKHIFLNLFLIKFPITAITSIIHRITGIFLFFCIPFILYFLKLSLESESSFLLAKNLMNVLYVKVVFLFLLWSFIYHFIMGCKHIVMDLGFFDSKTASANFALSSLIFSIILIFLSILI